MGGASLQAPDGLSGPPSEAISLPALRAENQRKQQSQARNAHQKLNATRCQVPGCSKMSDAQDLMGTQPPPGARWCPQLHFNGPKFQLLAESATKSAPAGLPRQPSAQTANGMHPPALQIGFGTISEWVAPASRRQMVSPGPPQRPSAFQLSEPVSYTHLTLPTICSV